MERFTDATLKATGFCQRLLKLLGECQKAGHAVTMFGDLEAADRELREVT